MSLVAKLSFVPQSSKDDQFVADVVRGNVLTGSTFLLQQKNFQKKIKTSKNPNLNFVTRKKESDKDARGRKGKTIQRIYDYYGS
jgi:hypothetical protein